MKRILSFLICLILLASSLCGCGRPPELAEIKARLEWLLVESAEVNDLVFGSGLPTYERIYDPMDSLEYYEDVAADKRYYYYTFKDGEKDILAYRTRSYGTDFNYLEIVSEIDGSDYVYHDENAGVYYVALPDYEEKKADFYYNSSFPDNYDVVVPTEAKSIDEMKKYIATVYSKEYAESLYETLFVGVALSSGSDSGILTARFMEFTDDNGTVWLMESNTYDPLIKEKRIYDLSTAKILRRSNAEYLRIEIESYLESAPEARLAITLSLIKQDGEWFLDSGSY